MECFKDDLNWDYKSKKLFRVIIIGAGIAGLAAGIGESRRRETLPHFPIVDFLIEGLKRAGHDVVILEQVVQVGEVGAGIQMAPNAARILGRFGLLEKIMDDANIMEKNSLRRWQNNEEIGTAPLMPQV